MEIEIHKNFYKGHPADFDNYCKKKYGNPTAKLITRRINAARAAENLTVLIQQGVPGRWHWLSGPREYQVSADLIHPKRLIFITKEEPKDCMDSQGSLDVKKILGLIIFEIADTHNE